MEPALKPLAGGLLQVARPERPDGLRPVQASGCFDLAAHGGAEEHDELASARYEFFGEDPLRPDRARALEGPLPDHPGPLSSRQVYPDAVPLGLRDRVPPRGPSHGRGVEIDDHVAPGLDHRPVDTDQAVDVLGAEDHEGHALRVPEGVDQVGFHVHFGRALLGTVRFVADVGALQEQDVDALGGLPEKLMENRFLATVAPEVA